MSEGQTLRVTGKMDKIESIKCFYSKQTKLVCVCVHTHTHIHTYTHTHTHTQGANTGWKKHASSVTTRRVYTPGTCAHTFGRCVSAGPRVPEILRDLSLVDGPRLYFTCRFSQRNFCRSVNRTIFRIFCKEIF